MWILWQKEEKIGHFHIYLSVRSRAVCGEKETEEGRKRGGRAATTGTQRAHRPSSVFSISQHTHAGTHTHLAAQWKDKQTERRDGREESEETEEEMKVCICENCEVKHQSWRLKPQDSGTEWVVVHCPWRHIDSQYMQYRHHKPSSMLFKGQEAPSLLWHTFHLITCWFQAMGNVNQHCLLVELRWTAGTLRPSMRTSNPNLNKKFYLFILF